jgi:secreted PhoX family phosphatase
MNNVNLAAAYNPFVPAGDYRQAEWAGACYSSDGGWLFANIQTPGITFAITGPWGKGPL